MKKTRLARITGTLVVSGMMLVATPAVADAAVAAPQRIGGLATVPAVVKDPYTCQYERAWLRYGSWGECVGTLQLTLNALYREHLAVDWSYGPATRAAVYRFQARYGLTYDGKAGPQTWATLCDAYFNWSHGSPY